MNGLDTDWEYPPSMLEKETDPPLAQTWNLKFGHLEQEIPRSFHVKFPGSFWKNFQTMIPVGGLLGENDVHKSSKNHHYSDVMMILSPIKFLALLGIDAWKK